MNAEPKKNDHSAERLSFRKALRQAPGRFIRVCVHNWGWKLLSLFLAVCLWAGLITQDPTLTRERTFNDVPVSIIGSEALISNGLVVLSGLDDDSLTVRLRADVPQRTYSSSLASNYNPRVDLSRIVDTGEQTLRILTSSSTTYGSVDSVTPDSVTVVVDEYVTNYRVPVSLNVIGDYPAGYYGSTPVLDPSSVAVSGPKSVVDQITNLYIDYDISRLAAQEGQTRTALPMRFTDANGNAMPGDRLSVTSANVTLRTITVEQRLYPTKTLAVSNMVLSEGTPADGYELKSITAFPGVVVAAGDSSSLSALDTLFVGAPIDITDKSESFTVEIDLRKPASLYYLSQTTLTLQVEIAPVITTASFDNLKLTLLNAADGMTAAAEPGRVSVTVTGPQNTLKNLDASMLTACVDLSGLAPGLHVLPITVEAAAEQKDGLSYAVTPASVSVTLTN